MPYQFNESEQALLADRRKSILEEKEMKKLAVQNAYGKYMHVYVFIIDHVPCILIHMCILCIIHLCMHTHLYVHIVIYMYMHSCKHAYVDTYIYS